MSFIQNMFADRIGGSNFGKDTKIYKFQKIKNAKAEALKNNPGVEILDFGIGEPDDMAPVAIREKLKVEVDKLENRFYADNGIQEFKDAAARYMKSLYGVDIDSQNEVVHGIGSKPVLALLPIAFINPGDYVLMTVPGYPVMGTYTSYLGGNVYNMPLVKENDFLPDLDAVPGDIRKKAKLLYLNYPNNPTGAGASVEFFEKAIAFAKENDIIIVHDAAYAALFYKSDKPLSFLSVPGAKEVGVEIHSMSKAFNMTGWRLSFVCGNPLVVKAYATVKDNTDSGQFRAIQKAAIEGLDNFSLTDPIKAKYMRRLGKLVDVLKKKGFDASMPFGTFYLYVGIPKKVKGGRAFLNAEDFSQFLIKEKLISTVPWDDAGNFFRMSVTFEAKDEKDEKRVLDEFEKRLSDLEFEF